MSSKRCDGEYDPVVQELSEESRKLQNLRELHSLKIANRCVQEEIERVKAQAERAQSEVMKLFLKIERVTGEHQALHDKIRIVRDAAQKKQKPAIDPDSATFQLR